MTWSKDLKPLGLRYMADDDYIGAIRSFEMAIRINSDDAEAYYNLGIAYSKLGKRADALKQYKVLKTLNPKKARELYHYINP